MFLLLWFYLVWMAVVVRRVVRRLASRGHPPFGAPATVQNPRERARLLWIACLTTGQEAQWRTTGSIMVIGQTSRRRYVVKPGYKIKAFSCGGHPGWNGCVIPQGTLWEGSLTDYNYKIAIAHKLWLENMEDHVLSVIQRS